MTLPVAIHRAALVVIAGALGGCASLQSVAPPVTPAVVSASGGASVATLEEGRRIFAGACTSCHAADPVSKYSVTEWYTIVDDMAERTKLDANRRAALIAYITAVKAVPAPATSG